MVVTFIRINSQKLTSKDIIAGNGRERFMIELQLIEEWFFKVLLCYIYLKQYNH